MARYLQGATLHRIIQEAWSFLPNDTKKSLGPKPIGSARKYALIQSMNALSDPATVHSTSMKSIRPWNNDPTKHSGEIVGQRKVYGVNSRGISVFSQPLAFRVPIFSWVSQATYIVKGVYWWDECI